MVENMLSGIRDVRSKLIQLKIYNILYWTPVQMQQGGFSSSHLRWRRNLESRDFVHMLF